MHFISNLLHDNIPYFDWVGFYLLENGKLHLGPFVGKPTEHTEIAIGEGICRISAETLRPVLVSDVTNKTNYLACSAETRSETVVPILIDGKFWGEIDIDSDTTDAFSERDKQFLERISHIIVNFLKHN
ncbi:MAG: GAF domain-containing protein [Proteobacteria bacterium]|nr:GAF domain-containing protein [Pseudomonadota bacterium]